MHVALCISCHTQLFNLGHVNRKLILDDFPTHHEVLTKPLFLVVYIMYARTFIRRPRGTSHITRSALLPESCVSLHYNTSSLSKTPSSTSSYNTFSKTSILTILYNTFNQNLLKANCAHVNLILAMELFWMMSPLGIYKLTKPLKHFPPLLLILPLIGSTEYLR